MERGRLGDWDVMNEYIDSTVGHIPVSLLCSLLVTIRGLVGPCSRYQSFVKVIEIIPCWCGRKVPSIFILAPEKFHVI